MATDLMDAVRSSLARFGGRLERLWGEYVGGEAPWRSRTDDTREEAHLAALAAASASERWRAASLLGRYPLRSREVIAALVRALADEEQFVRWQAAEALAHQEPGNVFPALVEALADRSPLRRAAAAEALGCLGGEGAGLTLVRHTHDDSALVRAAVAEALGQLNDPTLAAAMLPLLADPDDDVVRAAARGLGRIGNAVAAIPLAEALAKPGQPVLVRRALAAALVRAGHPDTQPQLLAALRDEDAQVRAYAADALANVGTETATGPLAELKADKHRLIRGTVSDRAGRAIELLERRGRRAGQQAADTTAQED